MAFSKARRLANLMSSASDTVPASKVNTVIADDAIGVDQIANSINSAITANTAKVTNAITTHTGDVTGGAALTIAVDAVDIPMLSASGSPGSTTFLRGDNAWAAPGGVVVSSSTPAVASEGTLLYQTTQDILYVSNGTAWVSLLNSAPTTTGGTVTIPTQIGASTFSYNLGLNFADDANTDAELVYSLESGTLPSGCTLPTAGNTAFTGTAANTAATYNFGIRATDSAGAFSVQLYTQVITLKSSGTGGTITTSGGYRYHAFTSSGTLAMNQATNCDYIVVAGGGSGGSANGTGNGPRAGAGAGGCFVGTGYSISGSINIVIGAGGAAVSGNNNGNNGSNTTVTGLNNAMGGGYGSGYISDPNKGGNGGSGGGASYTAQTSLGTSGQGNRGGGQATGAGGGGGKGAVGGSGPGNHEGGDGGVGIAWVNGTYYAGGGGAGGGYPSGATGTTGAGGNGGGGHGGPDTSRSPVGAAAGAANTGGGGGGSGYTGNVGAAGGSGIVIIRYAY